jgi:hypothetical protein
MALKINVLYFQKQLYLLSSWITSKQKGITELQTTSAYVEIYCIQPHSDMKYFTPI